MLKHKMNIILNLSFSLFIFTSSFALATSAKQMPDKKLLHTALYELDEAQNLNVKFISTKFDSSQRKKTPNLTQYRFENGRNNFFIECKNNKLHYYSIKGANKKFISKQKECGSFTKQFHTGCKKKLSKPFNRLKNKKKLSHLTSKPHYKSKISKYLNISFEPQSQNQSKPQAKAELKTQFLRSEIEKPPQFLCI